MKDNKIKSISRYIKPSLLFVYRLRINTECPSRSIPNGIQVRHEDIRTQVQVVSNAGHLQQKKSQPSQETVVTDHHWIVNHAQQH